MSDDTARPDLGATAQLLKTVVTGVRDEQLADPTPCADTPVAQLLDHLVGLTLAFRFAAEKARGGITANAPESSAERLDPRWRTLLPAQLDELVAAWRKPDAWAGDAEAGGVTLPAAVMGAVALNELLIHGWDLARATGQAYEPDAAAVEVSAGMLADVPAEGTPGMFGPPVPVPADAPAFDRVIAATGRDPGWTP